jgi:hypothetical protein
MRYYKKHAGPALVAAALLLSSGTASAQNGTAANTVDTAYDNAVDVAPVRQERDRDFPWGLLGLLGLAGLLGRKKANDIHVDARHDRRDA